MIPGPVRGHVPVDPGGAQRPPTETAAEAAADSGTSFADLLAAMLSPGAQLQAPAPGAAEAVFDRLDSAEMFNEAGLFRGAAPLLSAEAAQADAVACPAAVAAAPRTGLQADLDALASLGVDPATGALDGSAKALGPIATRSGGVAGSGAAGTALKPVHGGSTPSLPGAASAAPGTGAQSASAGPEAAGGARESSRAAASVAQIMSARTGAAAAQVSVQVAEGGISVLARVDKLSREERDRLRADISELLARHGFAGAEIFLNGEAWPLPQGEGN